MCDILSGSNRRRRLMTTAPSVSRCCRATLEGAAKVQVVAGISRASITGGVSHYAVLTGTLQVLINNAQGVFGFGEHPGVGVDGGYPETTAQTDQPLEVVTVRFGGSGKGEPRVGFAAQYHLTDRGVWVEWVRLVGSLGTAFQTDLGMTSLAARGKRSGTQRQPSEEQILIVTGNFNAASRQSPAHGVLCSQLCFRALRVMVDEVADWRSGIRSVPLGRSHSKTARISTRALRA